MIKEFLQIIEKLKNFSATGLPGIEARRSDLLESIFNSFITKLSVLFKLIDQKS